jgi:septum formation protein
MGLILASISPRRSELLSQLRSNFKILPSNVKELIDNSLEPKDLAMSLAEQKAKTVYTKFGESVLGADTIVVFKNMILGKPRNKNHAIEMLKALSGNQHSVITGVCYISKGIFKKDYAETIVQFNDLSDKLIEEYVASGLPFDKAGSYGIQDEKFELVSKYEGSYTNIVGLPLELVSEMLKEEK